MAGKGMSCVCVFVRWQYTLQTPASFVIRNCCSHLSYRHNITNFPNLLLDFWLTIC